MIILMSVGRMNPGNVTSSVNQDSMSQIEDELESNRTVITDDDGELFFFTYPAEEQETIVLICAFKFPVPTRQLYTRTKHSVSLSRSATRFLSVLKTL